MKCCLQLFEGLFVGLLLALQASVSFSFCYIFFVVVHNNIIRNNSFPGSLFFFFFFSEEYDFMYYTCCLGCLYLFNCLFLRVEIIILEKKLSFVNNVKGRNLGNFC